MNDRRSEARYRAVKLRVTLVLADGERLVATQDLSKRGACLTHSAPLAVGERRALRLMLDLGAERYSEPLELAARIVWCTELAPGSYQIGAAFVDVGAVAQQALEQLIYLLTRDVAEDDHGRLRFRTGLVRVVDPAD